MQITTPSIKPPKAMAPTVASNISKDRASLATAMERDLRKEAGCKKAISKALKSRVPARKNKYLEKMAAAGFKMPSTTSGVTKIPVKKPVAPGQMQKVATAKEVFSRIAKPVTSFVDTAAGARVHDFGMSRMTGSEAKGAFEKATDFRTKRLLVKEHRPESLHEFDQKRLEQNAARATMGLTAAATVAGLSNRISKRRALEEEALRYYAQGGYQP